MARKIKICIEEGCHDPQTTKEYCRLHYLKHWREIKATEKRKAARRLNRYVEGIMRRNPEAYDERRSRDAYTDQSSTEEVEGLTEDLGYSDPDSLDEIINNIKLGR